MPEDHKWKPRRPPGPFTLPVRVDPAGGTGPTRGTARGQRWRRISGGFYVPSDADPWTAEQRIAEAACLLPPGGCVTGWASLRMQWGGFFDGLGPDGRTQLPVALIVGPAQGRRKRPGVRFLQDRLPAPVMVQGVPCAPISRALLDEMRSQESLREAVVAMDMAAAAELTSITRMRSYVDRHAGWNGVPLVRRALDLASEDSASPQETRYRLVWELDAGLPRPLVNMPLFDAMGELLGYPDLLDPIAGLVGEYDGDDHRAVRRHSKDIGREGRFRDVRLEVTRATGPDLRDRKMLAARILAARGRAPAELPSRRAWNLELPYWFRPKLPLDHILDMRGEPD